MTIVATDQIRPAATVKLGYVGADRSSALPIASASDFQGIHGRSTSVCPSKGRGEGGQDSRRSTTEHAWLGWVEGTKCLGTKLAWVCACRPNLTNDTITVPASSYIPPPVVVIQIYRTCMLLQFQT
jgi:hypothetical protein